MQAESVQRRVTAYVDILGGITLVGCVVAYRRWPVPNLMVLLLSVLLTLLLERLYLINTESHGGSVLSPSHAMVFGALWLTGTAGALACNFVAVLANSAFRRVWRPERILLNLAAVGLPTMAAGALMDALHVQLGTALSLPGLGAASVALVAYFLLNTAIVAGVIALHTGTGLWQTWNRQFRWLAPQSLAFGLLGIAGSAAYIAMGVAGLLGFSLPLLAVYYSLRLYVHKAEADLAAMRSLNGTLENTNEQLIEALAAIVDARDALLYGHSAQVALYAVAIGRELGLAGAELERVRKAALLHDVGKVAVPEAILFKPGPLTAAEYGIIKHHATVGERLVSLVDQLHPLAILVGQHHESWDGGGYPRGLKGGEIELGARIINLCDALDTILSDRPYKTSRSLAWAVEEVRRCRGTQFDPAVVDAFLRVLEREGITSFVNSAYATAVGLRRSELFGVLRDLGLNVRHTRDMSADVAN